MVMNIKESILSSFFLHLIFILLVAALANIAGGLPGPIGAFTLVDLTADQPPPALQPHTAAPAEEKPSSDRQAAMQSLPEEQSPREAEKPEQEPEKKAETAPPLQEPAIAPQRKPEEAVSREAYFRFIMLHRQMYTRQANANMGRLLGEALKENKRQFYGGIALVTITFNPDKSVDEVMIESSSPDLTAFLQEVDWSHMPPPAAFSLDSGAVQVEVSIHEGAMEYRLVAF